MSIPQATNDAGANRSSDSLLTYTQDPRNTEAHYGNGKNPKRCEYQHKS